MKRLVIGGVQDLHFGRHVARRFDGLDAPFVVIHGANESGKSTLAEFLVWAIGGPWRTAALNSDIYQQAGETHVRGRLLGDLEGATIDIDAKFKILKKDRPNDLRAGVVGGRQVDADAIAAIFGALDPSDYQLIYRLYGGTLGDIGSGAGFSSLFTMFAMGSANATVNPRQSLGVLKQRAKEVADSRKKIGKSLGEIEKEIKQASRTPDEIIRLTNERDEIAAQVEKLRIEADDLGASIALVERAKSGLVHLEERDRAQQELELLGEVDENWRQVAVDCAALERAAEALTAAQDAVSEARKLADVSVARTGLPEDVLTGQSLTPPERHRLTSAAEALLSARAEEQTALAQLTDVEMRINSIRRNEASSRESLGLSEAEVRHLDAIGGELGGLMLRADRWLEKANDAVSAEGRLAAARARLTEAERTGPQGEPTGRARGIQPVWLAAGVVVSVLLSLVQPVVAVVAGVVTALAIVFSRTGQSAPSGDDDQIRIARLAVETAAGEHANAEKAASEHAEMLKSAAGQLARLLDQPDTTTARLAALADLFKLRRSLAEEITTRDDTATRVAEYRRKVESTEAAMASVLAERGVPMSLVNEQFAAWLALYETAVLELATLSAAHDEFNRVSAVFSSLTRHVADDIKEMSAAAVVGRARETADLVAKISSATATLSQAELAVAAAKMDSQEVSDLLVECPTPVELSSRQRHLDDQLKTLNSDRDSLIERRADINSAIEKLSGVEVLPGLQLQKGQCEEQIEELDHRAKVLDMAESVLSNVIARYERENQDPVVKSASDLVSRVEPDWGTILFSRGDDGSPILERLDVSSRLNDKFISDGGRALMYLALRIAFAKKDAERRGIALPLICDDPLVHFDTKRSEAAISLLSETSREHQVVLFTCEESTRDIALALGARHIEM